MRFKAIIAAVAVTPLITLPAAAQQWYAGASVGFNFQGDSSNTGSTGAFTTGNGAPLIPFGTAIDAGTPYGWKTNFDTGYGLSAEAGIAYRNGFRSGIELVHTSAGVKTHKRVNVANVNIDGVDAAVLTGSPTQLGATVAQVVADDDGKIRNTGVFANLYYDFNRGGRLSPYAGAGIGYSNVGVEYNPSNVPIIDGNKNKFALQLKGGASYDMTERFALYSELAYRVTDDIDLGNRLFPGGLSIENKQTVLSVGGRLKLGT